MGFPGSSAGKEPACNVEDLGSIPGLGRSLGEGKGYPFQYSGLENSMNCIGLGVAKCRTVHGNLQAKILVVSPFSRGSSQLRNYPGLPHCRQMIYQLSHQGSPKCTYN